MLGNCVAVKIANIDIVEVAVNCLSLQRTKNPERI